jgi:hypothetical protein
VIDVELSPAAGRLANPAYPVDGLIEAESGVGIEKKLVPEDEPGTADIGEGSA